MKSGSRVAYIAQSRIPSQDANSVHVMKMCQAFAQEGHCPRLIVPSSAEATALGDKVWSYYGVHTPFLIDRVNVDRYPGKYQRFVLSAIRQAKEHQADLIYTRYLLAAVWAAIFGIKTVFEVHSSLDSRIGELYFNILLRLPSCRRIVVISQALQTYYLKKYGSLLDPNRILVAPDAVDVERFQDLPDSISARQQLGLINEFTIGYAGNLYPGRGIEVVLELAQEFSNCHFLVIGGKTDDIDRYRSHLSESRKNVSFVGFVVNAELPVFLAACDVLLMPYQASVQVAGGSNTVNWMSPMKMFEYMATGRLIISSDLPVLREILNQGIALLCPPDDVEAWKSAVNRGYEDVAFRTKLGAQAQHEVQRYTWRKRVSSIMKLL